MHKLKGGNEPWSKPALVMEGVCELVLAASWQLSAVLPVINSLIAPLQMLCVQSSHSGGAL